MVSESDAFRCCLVAHIVGCRCVGMRAWCFMWLWCVLPQRLNHRARAVKAPVRFPLCAWLHCRREDSLQVSAAANAPPSPRCRASRRASGARCRRGRWCVFCGACRGVGGLGGCMKKRGAPPAAGARGPGCRVCCCRGRWCVYDDRRDRTSAIGRRVYVADHWTTPGLLYVRGSNMHIP